MRIPVDAQLPPNWRRWLLAALCFYLLILLGTRPAFYLDSFNYAKHIVDHGSGLVAPERDPFFDFGHALWRPMGYLLVRLTDPLLGGFFGGNQVFAAATALIGWSVLGGFASVTFLFYFLARLTGRPWIAAVTVAGFACTNAVMNYSQTGTAYMAGAACQIMGLYALHVAIQQDRLTPGRAALSGLLLGMSVCIWFPFCLSIPGVLCYGLVWREGCQQADTRRRVRFVLLCSLAIAALLIPVYASVMALRRIDNLAAARAWAIESRYQISPTRGFARMLFSVPRSFFFLGSDSLIWKRYLLRNAADPVSLLDVARTGIWKLAGVYVLFAALVLKLRGSLWGRHLLLCLAVTALPLVLFAAFLFDPSPPERYMAVFPFLFAALALTMARHPRSSLGRILTPLFFVAMLASNGAAMYRYGFAPEAAEAAARLESVNEHVSPRDVVLVTTFFDDAVTFTDARPFHPASRNRLTLFVTVPTGTLRILAWKRYAAEAVLGAWSRGGQAWVSHRLLGSRPSPKWWVEGDENRLNWSEVPAFFQRLSFAQPVGGEDGFSILVRSGPNEQFLRSLTMPEPAP